MDSGDTPSDEVLLELGQLVWAAINLEDATNAVCRSIKPRRGPFDDSNIGPANRKMDRESTDRVL